MSSTAEIAEIWRRYDARQAVSEDEAMAAGISPGAPRLAELRNPGGPSRSTILAEANDAISRDRANAYGPAERNFGQIADFWNWWLADICVGRITPRDVAIMLAGVKLARLKTSPRHADNYVDLCGYAALAGEIALERAPVDLDETH